jgi:hypothetical protein
VRAKTFIPDASTKFPHARRPNISLTSDWFALRSGPYGLPHRRQATAQLSTRISQKSEQRGPAAQSRCPPEWICHRRHLSLGTGHSNDPRKLRVWAVALLHSPSHTWPLYAVCHPTICRRRNTNRGSPPSKANGPATDRCAHITAHCATEVSDVCHGCCSGSAPQHLRQASSASLVPAGGLGGQKSGGQKIPFRCALLPAIASRRRNTGKRQRSLWSKPPNRP